MSGHPCAGCCPCRRPFTIGSTRDPSTALSSLPQPRALLEAFPACLALAAARSQRLGTKCSQGRCSPPEARSRPDASRAWPRGCDGCVSGLSLPQICCENQTRLGPEELSRWLLSIPRSMPMRRTLQSDLGTVCATGPITSQVTRWWRRWTSRR